MLESGISHQLLCWMYGPDTGPRILKHTIGGVFRSPGGIWTSPGRGYGWRGILPVMAVWLAYLWKFRVLDSVASVWSNAGWRQQGFGCLLNIISRKYLLTGPLPPKSLLSRVTLHWVGGDAYSLPSWGYPINRRRQEMSCVCPSVFVKSITLESQAWVMCS